MSFTHLHLHSIYSRLDGAIEIPALMQYCKEQGFSAVSLTDHGNLCGAIEFYTEAKKAGIKPIIGQEIYLVDDHLDKTATRYHEILLAKDLSGYKNLVKLSSLGFTDGLQKGQYPCIDDAQIEAHSAGLICLSGCISSRLARIILGGLDLQNHFKELASAARAAYSDPTVLVKYTTKWYGLKAASHNAKGPKKKKLEEQAAELASFIESVQQAISNDTLGELITEYNVAAYDAWTSSWERACKHVENRLRVFGDRYFFETQLEFLPQQKIYNNYVRTLATKYNRPAVVTGDCHYLHQCDVEMHRTMLAVKTTKNKGSVPKVFDIPIEVKEKVLETDGSESSLISLYDGLQNVAKKNTKVYTNARSKWVSSAASYYFSTLADDDSSDTDVGRPYHEWEPQFWVKSEAEMLAGGARQEELDNTNLVADLVDLRIPINDDKHRIIHMPTYPLPIGTSVDNYLRELCESSVYYRADEESKARLAYELSVIEQAGFANYFLIVWDYINYVKSIDGLTGPARGSAAGSLVTYLLGITKLDPMQFPAMMFERFLTPGRPDLPDIDTDFDYVSAEKVFQYCAAKYGNSCVAKIGTISEMGVRQALQDVGRVLDIPYPDVELASRILKEYRPDEDDEVEDNKAKFSIAAVCNHNEALMDLRTKSPLHEKWFTLADQLQGKKRNASIHASGVAIASDALVELGAPLMVALGNDTSTIITQYNMDDLALIGVPKFDQLKLANLNIIADTESLIGSDFSVESLPLDDPETYIALSRGDNLGVFQMAAPKVRATLKSIKPQNLLDIAAVITVIRPGLFAKDAATGLTMEELYKARRRGELPVKYMFDFLEPITKHSYGIMLYQEDVLRTLWACGFSKIDADKLRKVMSKKIMSEAKKFETKFLDGATRSQNLSTDQAMALWDLVVEFAAYSFNLSHALAYGLLGYWTAYLKTHYPAQFLVATLTTMASKNSPAAQILMGRLLEDCNAFGRKIPLLPPDVNKSLDSFSIEYNDDGQECIRFGLSGIPYVVGIAPLVAKARLSGPFKSVQDFDERVSKLKGSRVNKNTLINLAKAGAFDTICAHRSAAIHDIEILRAPTKRMVKELTAKGWQPERDAVLAKEQSDLCFGYQFVKDSLTLLGQEVDSFFTAAPGERIVIGGQVSKLKLFKTSRKGTQYHGLSLKTEFGEVQVFVFASRKEDPVVYMNNIAEVLKSNASVIISGTVKDESSFFADAVRLPKKAYRLNVQT